MTARTIRPGPLRGCVAAPSSKSYTHRALVAGFLSARPFSVDSPLDSEDTRATARALHLLGAPVSMARRRWTVRAEPLRRGTSPIEIDCGESGTTLRFATVLAALEERPVRFRGRGRLAERPMRPLVEALTELGATVRPSRGRVPFTIRGPIRGGSVRLDASESSQFASALLLALPSVREDSRVVLEGRLVSEPYLDATLAVLGRLGILTCRRGREFRIGGGQRYVGHGFVVPGDASSAAYLWVAGAITGGPVSVGGVGGGWPQADLAVLDLLARAGADVRKRGATVTVRRGTPRSFSIDLTPCPDLYPLAGVLAASIPGRSRLLGASQVVHKESDRRAETARLAASLGARVRDVGGGLSIEGREELRPLNLPHLTDHRMVMSAAIGALAATGPSQIGEVLAVRKSFPGFWKILEELGGEVART